MLKIRVSCWHYSKMNHDAFRHYRILCLKYIVKPIKKANNDLKCNTIPCLLNYLSEGKCCLCCLKFYCKSHLKQHSLEYKGHVLFMDIEFGFIYCVRCSANMLCSNLVNIVIDLYDKYQTLNFGVRKCFMSLYSDLLNENLSFKKIDTGKVLGMRPLVRIGSTCYMNSIIQILVNTPSLIVYFLGNLFECRNHFFDMCYNCVLHEIFTEFYKPENADLCFIPHKLLVLSCHNFPQFRSGGEQDALEFFVTTVKSLCIHNSNFEISSNINFKSIYDSSENRISNSINDKTIDEINNISGILTKCCIPNSIFHGIIECEVICSNCKTSSINRPIFINISLNLDTKKESIELKNLLFDFIKKEDICYNCEKCNRIVNATKQDLFYVIPKIFVIHFIRFISTPEGAVKNEKPVEFPLTLNMSDYMTKRNSNGKIESSNITYNLYAVVSHLSKKGKSVSINTGHYISYVKNRNGFFIADDEFIAPVDVLTVLKAEAFILFYHCNTSNFK